MIKLIVTDVDGTIVDRDEILHEEYIRFVKNLREQGIDYTIATGRAERLVRSYTDRLNIRIPFIACNGGTIVQEGQTLFRQTMSIAELKTIMETADAMDMALLYTVEGEEIACRRNNYIEQQQAAFGRYLSPRQITDSEWETLRVEKLIVFDEKRDGSIREIEELCRQLPEDYYYKLYGLKAIDILPAAATKEYGLERLVHFMGLKLENVMFIGDDLNDIEAIEAAGIGVAVGNAQPAAKQAADYISTEPCYRGVMEAVNKFLL